MITSFLLLLNSLIIHYRRLDFGETILANNQVTNDRAPGTDRLKLWVFQATL